MRIAQVSPLYESVPPKLYGGTERIVSWLTEELVRQGHDVTLFASGDSVTSARLVPISARSLRLDEECKDEYPHIIRQLEMVIENAAEFDIIHWHTDYFHFPLSRRLATPHVTTLHGRLDIPDLVPLYQEFTDIPVISISNSQRKPLPMANWQGTVYHGMARDLIQPRYEPGEYLAFLGRISPEKGVDTAIEIAKRAGMKLKIAAKVSKADTSYFLEQIKPLLNHPLVEYLGEIDEQRKIDFLGNAYALLFPITWPEPFGIVMIEAMASATPIIAFPGGSVAEVMDEGRSGFVVTNVEDAVEAVSKIAGFDRRLPRQVFEERFTAERMTRDYVAIYEKVIAEQGAHLQPASFRIQYHSLPEDSNSIESTAVNTVTESTKKVRPTILPPRDSKFVDS